MQKKLEHLLSKTRHDFGIIDLESPVRSAEKRMRYILPVKKLIAEEKAKIRERFYHGAGGIEIANANTMLVDNIIKKVCSRAEMDFREYYGNFYPSCAIIAIGGYGRGDLNPFSDIDVLFLYKQNIDRFIEGMAKHVIAFLWDLGFEVGHSVRSIDNCISIAQSDISAKTAMMESRHITGNYDIYIQFVNSFQHQVVKKGVGNFIRQKIKEREERIEIYKTIYLSEPNIKEGIGGLRDFHTAIWIACARFGLNTLAALLHRGIIDQQESASLSNAFDFLLKVRSGLHFLNDRKNDLLTHDYQGAAADTIGYTSNDTFSATELFMYDYYLHTTNICRFSSAFIRRCENYGRKKNILKPFISKDIGDGFSYYKSEIYLKEFNPAIFKSNPLLFIKIFLYCQKFSLTLSENIKNLIRSSLDLFDDSVIKSKETGAVFLLMLKEGNISCILRMMHEVGALGKYIEEFNDLTYRIHTDPYHKYTIDEHTLKAIEFLEGMLNTDRKEFVELANIYKSLSKPEIIKLALLLHDIGKGRGRGEEHADESSKLAKAVITRLRFGNVLADEVGLLVKNHLLMDRTAQRRDIHDSKAVTEFAKRVGNTENLKMLYLMTYADINAVGPNSWSAWKASLIRDLYYRCHEFFTRDETEKIPADSLISILKSDIIEALIDDVDEKVVNRYFNNMPDKYILSINPKKIVEHIRLTEKLAYKKVAVECSYNNELGFLEIMVCTTGKTGVFSKIAGTLTAKNLNILGAQIYTRKDGIAIDTIQVASINGMPAADKQMWGRIESDLTDVIEDKKSVEGLIHSRYKYVKAKENKIPEIKPEVIVDNSISDTHTVIEIINPDRAGILYVITNQIFAMGIDIYLAKISTEADKGINVFYVTDLTGAKITDKKFIDRIKSGLTRCVMLDISAGLIRG